MTVYNRRPVVKWIKNETFAEIKNETANFHNIECVLLNENLRYVPMSCNLTFSALCEYGSEKDHTENNISAKTGIIVGGILGFIVALVIIVVFIYCRRKRNKREKQKTEDSCPITHTAPTTPKAATQLDDGQYFVLDPGPTGFNRSNTNYSEKDNEAQYASSSDGVYDVTNERRHIKKDETNIYSHTVDDVYDTSAHDRRGKERDNAYDDCVIQNDG
ncbi:uncharacterized protein [Mytilus edulis]|uniref:uncharacterized protein n=1 Tax=Mytilus edulis TaxID=6550 RepID=UPI0039F1015F